MTRESFNREWTVQPKTSIFAQLSGPASEPVAVTLPDDALSRAPRSETGQGKNAYFPVSSAFAYRKTFPVPEEWRDKHVRLEFEGAHRDAMVFVNGAYVSQWRYGYSEFAVALDEHLVHGQDNTIRVDTRAHDDSRWYSGNGLHRDVTLVVTDLVHIAPGGPTITTPDVDDERAVVEIVVPVRNLSRAVRSARVEIVVRDAGDAAAVSSAAPVTVRAGDVAPVRQRIYLPDPQRWSADRPYLYSVEIRVWHDDRVADDWDGVLGVRTLKLDPAHGLRINGEVVKLRGACIHHDNGLLGAAAIGRAEERRVELLKAAGFNAIRSSHNPLSRAMLDACDRLGMIVLDEAFDIWTEGKSTFDYSLDFPEWWERDLEAMVAKDRNHPSVVFYSIGNEIPETGTPLGGDWSRKLAEKVRELDNTRFVTNGINGFVSVLPDVAAMMQATTTGAAEGGVNAAMNSAGDMMNRIATSPLVTARTEESFSVLDVAGMNYGDGRYEPDRTQFPSRIILGTETYASVIDRNWRLVTGNPHVIGDFTWTGWDYLGEVGLGRHRDKDDTSGFEGPYPWLTAWVGDLDITGHRRPQSYYREIVFGLRATPYIAVGRPGSQDHATPGAWSWTDAVSTWTWNTAPGTPLRVEVYSHADEVELFLDDISIGRKPAGPAHRYRACFDVTYQPGTLTAIALRDGAVESREVLHTAGPGLRLSVGTDRATLAASDHDLAHLDLRLTDDHGVVDPSSDRPISVTVTGAGVLQALGTGRPVSTEPFHSDRCTTFDGRALAIIRPTGPGTITVTVEANDLAPVTTTIEVEDINE